MNVIKGCTAVLAAVAVCGLGVSTASAATPAQLGGDQPFAMFTVHNTTNWPLVMDTRQNSFTTAPAFGTSLPVYGSVVPPNDSVTFTLEGNGPNHDVCASGSAHFYGNAGQNTLDMNVDCDAAQVDAYTQPNSGSTVGSCNSLTAKPSEINVWIGGCPGGGPTATRHPHSTH